MKFIKWLWSLKKVDLWALLPDRCEIPYCPREGIRGNENIINGMYCCDYCYIRLKNTRYKTKVRL